MITKFKANFLYAQTENDVLIVGFADDEFETNSYVLFQKMLVSSEEEKKCGFDKIHITYCDQMHSAYGEILKFVLKNSKVEITFDAKTAEALNINEQLEIVFLPNDKKMIEIKKSLTQLFINDENVFFSEV